MTKQDFLNKLRETLAGEVNADVISENVRFYEDYFMVEQRKGRSEAEILEELGDPRLLARTIIDTSASEDGAYRRTSYTEESQPYEEEQTTGHVYRMPGWLLMLILIAAIVLVVFVVGSVVSFLLPVLIPVLLVVFIVGLIRRNG